MEAQNYNRNTKYQIALTPLLLIHAVISWCGFIAHRFERQNTFSFLFCAVENKKLNNGTKYNL